MNEQKNIQSGFAASGIYPFVPSRVCTKIPEVTKESVKQFDSTLLEYSTASLKSQPLNVASKQKRNITAGKSVYADEVDRITKGKTSTKKKSAKVTLLKDVRLSKENTVFSISKNEPLNNVHRNGPSDNVNTNIIAYGELSDDEKMNDECFKNKKGLTSSTIKKRKRQTDNETGVLSKDKRGGKLGNEKQELKNIRLTI